MSVERNQNACIVHGSRPKTDSGQKECHRKEDLEFCSPLGEFSVDHL